MSESVNQGSRDWLEEIDHTGDVGILVRAETVEELFARAAWGMFSVLTDLEEVEAREFRSISVEADDRGALLVAWLSELNFIHSTEYFVFSDFVINHLGEHTLRATVGGEPIDAEKHTIYTEIKAVTYHGLKLEETDRGWQLQVIFDM